MTALLCVACLLSVAALLAGWWQARQLAARLAATQARLARLEARDRWRLDDLSDQLREVKRLHGERQAVAEAETHRPEFETVTATSQGVAP